MILANDPIFKGSWRLQVGPSFQLKHTSHGFRTRTYTHANPCKGTWKTHLRAVFG